jgi:acetyl esterase/lipase
LKIVPAKGEIMIRWRALLCFVFFFSAYRAAAQGQPRKFSVDDLLRYRDPVPFQRGDLSTDGSHVAYVLMVKRPLETGERFTPSGVRQVFAGTGVYVQDLQTHATVQVSAKGAAAFGARWSPDSRHLAFFTDERGTLEVAIWDRATGKTRLVDGINVRVDILGDAAEWSQNNALFVEAFLPGENRSTIAKELPGPGSTSNIVSVLTHLHDNEGGHGRVTDASGLLRESQGGADIVMVNADSAQARRLCRGQGILAFAPSPDGRTISVLSNLRLRKAGLYDMQADLYVAPVAPALQTLAKLTPVASGLHVPMDNEFGAWSWDSRRFAYVESYTGENGVDTGTGELMIVDAEKKEVHPAVSGFDLPDSAKALASVEPSLNGTPPPAKTKFSVSDQPIWSADGRTVIVLGKGDVWSVDIDEQKARNLTGDMEQVFRRLVPFAGKMDGAILAATDKEFVRTFLSNGKHEIVPVGEFAIDTYFPYFLFRPASAKNTASDLLFLAGSQRNPKDYWLCAIRPNGEASLTRVTRMNAALDGVEWSERRLLKWKTLGGESAEGILMLPKSRAAGAKIPLIAWVYGGAYGQARDLNEFGLLPQEVLVANGYAVLLPDIPMPGVGFPYKQIADGVLPALDAAIATGVVDPDKMGVFGQSYGGYTVNALICQTNRFKAAVSADGVADLPNVYLGITAYGTAWAEGQGRMGGTLWQYTDRYIANSPLYHYESVQTPLLATHGDQDSVVPLEESERMYRGLVRLDKDVELAVYKDSDHSFYYWADPQLRDFLDRVVGWFDQYVKQPAAMKIN